MTNLKKFQFSTLSCIRTDRDTKIRRKLHELMEERQTLDYDSGLIKDATRAASKITTGETPTEEEKDSLEELQNNYPAFFDSDEDEEESESSTSLLGKIMVVKDYIRKEKKANSDTVKSLQKKYKGKSVATEQDNLDTVVSSTSEKDVIAGPSLSKKAKLTTSEKDVIAGPSLSKKDEPTTSGKDVLTTSGKDVIAESSSSGKGESSSSGKGESSSSGKGESSGSFCDDEIPYNPFDDIGAD